MGSQQVGEEAPLFIILLTYLSYIILIVFGHVRDFLGKRLRPSAYKHLSVRNVNRVF